MRFKKIFKWVIITITAWALGIFLFAPLGMQDEVASSTNVDINNYPELVYEDLQDVHNAEKWLPGHDSTQNTTVTFDDEALKPSFTRKDIRSSATQTVTLMYARSNSNDMRIKDISYNIVYSNHGYAKRINFTVMPDGNLIGATGENVNTTSLSSTEWTDFSKAGFFEKTIGKWKTHHNDPFYTEPELKVMSKKIKDFVEDTQGRLLDRE